MSDAAVSKSSTPFHHGDLAQALVSAAAGLIAARGATDFSLREVAESVGVTHTAAYRHFASKTQLLLRIAVLGFEDLKRALVEAALDAAVGPDRLTAIGRAYIDFAAGQPGAYRTMFHPSLCASGEDAELRAVGAESLALIHTAVVEGQQAGRLRTDRDPALVAASLWAAQHGYAGLLIDHMLVEDDNALPATRIDRDIFLGLIVDALRQP